MSLTQALSAAISGLRANQSGLALVAANVANADTPGYVRKTVNQVATAGNNTGIGVRVTAVQRELDQYVQRQLRVENAGASYADTRAQFYERLQDVYGDPNSTNTLESVYNDFTTALQSLTTSPDDAGARNNVVSTAQALTQQLNQMSDSINGLRSDAELGLSDAVTTANQAMSQIANLNRQIAASSSDDSETATLLDQRDSYIDQLSQLMDITVVRDSQDQVSVFTNSGIQLVGEKASKLSFNAQGTVTPTSRWSSDPSQSTLGTLTLTSPTGGAVDLIQSKAIRSGQIAAYVQLRDEDLVQAQTQIDAVAAAMATSLSDKTTAGSAVTSGLQSGFDVDIGGLSAGNTITISYTDSLTNTPRTLSLVRVDDPKVLPLADTATARADDKVVGIDFSGGLSTVMGQINAALGATGMTASNPSGSTLRILDDGAGNIVNVNSVSTTATATGLSDGSVELPLFTDGTNSYSGAIMAGGPQSIGFAGRISVNADLLADPSKLVLSGPDTAAGDSTRADFMYQQFTAASLTFPPDTGIGSVSTPFVGSMTTFMRQIVSQQGEASDAASSLKQGQDVVLSSLQQRFSDGASVNIDQEMTNLLNLQNSYAANARVMSVVKDMFDTLIKM
jgi:flagellar hook-associated protein 1 FlgK